MSKPQSQHFMSKLRVDRSCYDNEVTARNMSYGFSQEDTSDLHEECLFWAVDALNIEETAFC